MKQKRKVKSLISSNEKSNVGLTALLCLLGGILVFGAVALFTSSVGVEAAGEGEMEYDNGIEDNVEVLLNFKMAGRNSLGNAVNEMEFTGGTFYMKGNAGIAVDYVADGSINGGNNVNYLGGQSDGANIASDNITIIGGQTAKVFQNNNNATSLGGIGNTVNNGSNKVAPVMLGGNGNEISANQEGSAIVGGSSNKITGGGEYDFILGGEGSQINGKNVIVGGKGVNVDGKSDLFAFSDDRGLTPEGGKAFYLFVKNGLGLNKAAVNSGVDSNGAVSFGAIDINVSCTSADVGVQGTWNGCLVGCTQASKNDHNKWEMMDHGDDCERRCKDNSTHCKVLPIEPTPPDDYTSECTVGGVDTSNSTQCAPNRLSVYENVMFETYLIDSSAECPEGIENKCVFRCNKDYHLTGNIAGGAAGTKKCYADCTLPWNGEKIKHNETVVAYNAKTVACSNTDWVFPVATAIVNAPNTSEYPYTRTLNGMLKTTEAAGRSYESCTNYTHKKTLVCYNGELYIANTNGTKTNTKALGNTGAWYGYDVCETKDYKCPTGMYNLTRNYISNTALDNPKPGTDRNNTDRGITQGVRGEYKLCQDWTPSVGNSECKVGQNGSNGTVANNYHYQLVKCNDHYSTGTDNNQYECKKSCQMKDEHGNWTYKDKDGNEYKHNRVITGYTLSSEDCTKQGNGTCHAATIICVDGTWIMGSNKNGTQENTQYLYNDCELKPYKCDDRFEITQSNQTTRQTRYPKSVYESCTPYKSINEDKFKCTAQTKEYDLIGCDGEYHTENNKYCISNEKSVTCTGKPSNSSYYIGYNDYKWNGTRNAGSWVHTYGNCEWYCRSTHHQVGNRCDPNTINVPCDSSGTPENAIAEVEDVTVLWNGTTYDDPVACGRHCKEGYEGENCGDECVNVSCEGYPFTASTCPEHGICNSACTPQSADCSKGSSVVKLTSCVRGYHPNSDYTACEEDQHVCQGDYPDGVTRSTEEPDNDTTNWFCSTNINQACAFKCPTGQECDGTSNCKPIDGIACSEGTYLPANSTTCSTCPCGSYCPGGTYYQKSYDQGKTACGAGKWSNAGSDSCSNISCGYYGTSACSATPNKCAAGTYSTAGSSNCSTCNGTLSSNQCSCTGGGTTVYCAPGKYLPANSESCSNCVAGNKCPGGTYTKNQPNDQGIEQCSCGTYSNAGASSCTSCGAGKWSSAGSSSCSNISCGYYGSSACSATPNKCAAGTYSTAGSSNCSTCNGTLSSNQCSCTSFACIGEPPSGTTTSSVTPTSSKKWTCATNLTQACTYTCPAGQHCNEAENGCEQDQVTKYECTSTHYNCTNDGTASNEKATEGSDRYTWDCPDEKGCYEECPTGQTLHNGSCAIVEKTCEDYGKFSKPILEPCHQIYHYDDGNGGTLTCYDEKGGCGGAGFAQYDCWASLNTTETIVDYHRMDDGNYCVRTSGSPNPGGGISTECTETCREQDLCVYLANGRDGSCGIGDSVGVRCDGTLCYPPSCCGGNIGSD